MSLVDLKSDLAKFRQTVSKDEKESPASSKATDANNFATLQPITDRLSQLRPSIGEWKTTPIESLLNTTKLDDISKPNNNFTSLEKKLGETKLDDIKKNPVKNILMNSVSKLSPVNNEFDTNSIIDVYEEDVISEIAKLRKEKFVSKLNKSDIEVKSFVMTETQFTSRTEINSPEQSFDRSSSSPNINKNDETSNNIVNPEIKINVPSQTFDRKLQSPILQSKDVVLPDDDVTVPNIDTSNRPALFNDLSGQSVVINKELFSPLNNIINPEISLQKIDLILDREDQSPDIITETNISEVVTDPKTKILKSNLSTNQEKDNSDLNIDGKISKYVPISRLSTMSTSQIVDTIRYDLSSNQEKDNSDLNVDVVTRTNPSGRNEDATKSNYSTKGIQEVNFFKNINASGFTANIDLFDSEYKPGSQYVWIGKNIPSVNFIQDKNAIGFKNFVEFQKTLYIPNTSVFGFEDIPETDFFDIPKKFTTTGFKSFLKQYESDYRNDSSAFTWIGKRAASPEVNYFDITKTYTKAGFHKFAALYDTKYNTESSTFNWDGKRESAPVVNYFDIKKTYTKAGFHKFARLYDTKYIPESSGFDWDGKSEDAPAVNYFDIISKFTTAGFHIFAPFLETKYIPESSRFDWDGTRELAPFVNYFDISSKFTTAGFQTFAPFLETKYIPDSSGFDWNGLRQQAPEINYFDISNQFTTAGFHKFAGLYDSKYVPESSRFDWDGARVDAPTINYFDTISKFTLEGFHTFAQLYDSKYVPESSGFDWDGTRESAPAINYFDLTKKNTSEGFHTFAALYDTKYIPQSSEYDWDGARVDAPAINYFDLTKKNTTAGFHTFAAIYDTKYIPESSGFDWDGFRLNAPFVNYFDLTKKNTTAGFHTFAAIYDTKYVPESSIFDWDGSRNTAPAVNYFDLTKKNTTDGFHTFAALYDTKYIPESSGFDWDGFRKDAPNVDYFDKSKLNTKSGFHTFAQLYDSKYIEESSIYDWDGLRLSAPSVDYFDKIKSNTKLGFHTFAQLYDSKYVEESSIYDWNGLRKDAPNVDYFDINKSNTTSGFHTLAQLYDTKYISGSSIYDWDGFRKDAPNVDYFDLTKKNTTDGFHTFAAIYDTKYVSGSSIYDWDGFRKDAPNIDYFDLTKKNTTDGFHTFAQMLDSKYISGSSIYDWDGDRLNAPSINYFDSLFAYTKEGFHTFAQLYDSKYVEESSIYDWNGLRKDAPSVDYFDLTKRNTKVGFHTLASIYDSKYIFESSVYDWNGLRKDAPQVQFFNKLIKPNAPQNPVNITNLGGLTNATIGAMNPGFKKFFIDKTNYDLKSEYSYYSTENGTNKSKVNGIPTTNFFGFQPFPKLTGFMVNMKTYDGTLYPIINPELKYDFDTIQRNSIETIRNSAGLLLDKRDEYAPIGLGKKLWTSGNSTTFASLTNQVPESKIKAESSYYGKPYSATMKNVTEGKGYLAKWAITRQSPSPLDQQYSKYNLRQDAYESGFVGDQPFVLRDIGERWGFGVNFDEGLIRGGAVTMAERALYDVQRIGKWLISTKGLLWNVKQIGLQLMNPNVDYDPDGGFFGSVVDFLTTFGMSPTQIFNPLSTVINVGGSAIGLRVPRHSLLGAIDSRSLNRYETSTINREKTSPPNDNVVNYFKGLETPTSDGQQTNYSRLIGLMKELLPHSFRTLYPDKTQSQDFLGHSKIHRISTWFGGPNAPLGIGGTKIRRARHPYLTYYTTDGNLPLGFDDATFITPGLTGTTTRTLLVDNNELFNAGGKLSYMGNSIIAASTNPAYPDTARRTQFYNHYDRTGDKPNKYSDVLYENYTKTNRSIFGDIRGLSAIFAEGPVDLGQSYTPLNLRASYEISSSMPSQTITRIKGINPFNPTRKTFSYNIKAVNPNNADTFNLDPIYAHSVDDETNHIKKYLTATYSNLRINRTGSRVFNDFRYDALAQAEADGKIVNRFIGNPETANGYYNFRNMEDYLGMGKQGEPGNPRFNLTNSTIAYNQDTTTDASVSVLKKGQVFRGDRINILDYKRAKVGLTTDLVYEKGKYKNNSVEGRSDLIEFYFSGITLKGNAAKKTEIIPFRATFGNINDSHNPKWNPIKYMGRADPLYVYDGYERSISFDFVVHIGSRDELKASWRKLNFLASWTAPNYTKGGLIKGPLIRLNIGHLYRKLPGFINSLSYTFDNTGTNWETANLPLDYKKIEEASETTGENGDIINNNYSVPGALQLPKHIQISVGYTPVGVYRPEYNGVMYQLYDDSDANLETGLMPDAKDKVNYFRTYDSVEDINDVRNSELLPVPVGKENDVQDADPNVRENDTSKESVIDIKLIK